MSRSDVEAFTLYDIDVNDPDTRAKALALHGNNELAGLYMPRQSE